MLWLTIDEALPSVKSPALFDRWGNYVPGKFFVILNGERMRLEDLKPVFWRPNGSGYTDNILLAGVYSEPELKALSLSADDPIVPIEELPELLRCDKAVLKQLFNL